MRKTFERPASPLVACSACAGDYEDPERTDWREELDDREDEQDDHEQPAPNSFPVPPQ